MTSPADAERPPETADESWIEPDPTHRRRMLLVLLVVAATGLGGIVWLQATMQDVLALSERNPARARGQVLALAQWLFALLTLGAAAYGVLAFRVSWRAWHTAQFPPPGTKVLSRQRCFTGRPARRRAVIGMVAAVLVVVGSLLAADVGMELLRAQLPAEAAVEVP